MNYQALHYSEKPLVLLHCTDLCVTNGSIPPTPELLFRDRKLNIYLALKSSLLETTSRNGKKEQGKRYIFHRKLLAFLGVAARGKRYENFRLLPNRNALFQI